MILHQNKNKGFTLIELLIAMAISGIVLAGITTAFQTQVRNNVTQQMVVDMHQTIRGAMYIMQREIRMAGCDLTGNAGAGVTTAQANSIQVTINITGGETDGLDNDNDGTVDEPDENVFGDDDCNDGNEQIRYALTADGRDLGRETDAVLGLLPLAENIDAINFVYLDGANPPAVIPTPVTANRLADIRAVQITIVARSGQNIPGLFYRHTDNRVYQNQQGTVILAAQNDAFRRQLLTAEVRFRNLGL